MNLCRHYWYLMPGRHFTVCVRRHPASFVPSSILTLDPSTPLKCTRSCARGSSKQEPGGYAAVAARLSPNNDPTHLGSHQGQAFPKHVSSFSTCVPQECPWGYVE